MPNEVPGGVAGGRRTVLVTGGAGFIGSNACRLLLEQGHRVHAIDSLNHYYAPALKRHRVEQLESFPDFSFQQLDTTDSVTVGTTCDEIGPTVIINLAAQAGARYSVLHPDDCFQKNVVGFVNVLHHAQRIGVDHFIYASSSSVYGNTTGAGSHEDDHLGHPESVYGATKQANEILAYSYAHNHGLPATGLRFFTVYGPAGRPDMAYFRFTDQFFAGEPITVFEPAEEGAELWRDFTFIDDTVASVVGLIPNPPTDPVPHTIFNIGNQDPVQLRVFIAELEGALSQSLGRQVSFTKNHVPLGLGDVLATHASTDKLRDVLGFQPHTPLATGLRRFTDWYVDYYAKR